MSVTVYPYFSKIFLELTQYLLQVFLKLVSYSGKYSLSASRAHQSHLQFSFVVGMFSLR